MKLSSKIYSGLVFAFLFAPIVVLLIFSFNEAKSLSVFSGFSLKWYQELFRDECEASLAVVHPGITFTNITAHYPKLIFAIIKHPMKWIFMKPEHACLSLLCGVFEPTAYHTWIGPRLWDVWGLPVHRRLHTCTNDESAAIATQMDALYHQLKQEPDA